MPKHAVGHIASEHDMEVSYFDIEAIGNPCCEIFLGDDTPKFSQRIKLRK